MTSEGPSTGPGTRGGDASGEIAPTFDTSVAHVARVYDYWLGGKDNFAADRAAGDQAIAAYPDIVFSVRANRAFLARAVRYLAGEAGIRQFLDIGTGIPTANNTHEVAQDAAPSSRIVYVDNDPVVLAHARALLTSMPEGSTSRGHPVLRRPGPGRARDGPGPGMAAQHRGRGHQPGGAVVRRGAQALAGDQVPSW